MSFNASRESAGENVLNLLTDDVNRMLRDSNVDEEEALIRAAGDIVHAAIGNANNADHHVRYSIAGSVRETNGGIRSFAVSVEATRVRGAQPRTTSKPREPWTPRKDSPTAAPRVLRDGGTTSGAGSTGAIPSTGSGSGPTPTPTPTKR